MVTKINLHIDAQQCYDFFTDVAEEVVLIRSNFLCLALVQNISLVYSIHILNEEQIDFRQSSKAKCVYNDDITLYNTNLKRKFLFTIEFDEKDKSEFIRYYRQLYIGDNVQ